MDTIDYKVVNSAGKEVGSLGLDKRIFGAAKNPALVQEVVRWQLASRRAGTQSTLHRGEVRGGKKKPWKQKGTGRARAGSSVSPLWVGGAAVHGPKPRKYDYRLPKRTKIQALCSVLTTKVEEGALVVVDAIESKNGKTKELASVFAGVNPDFTAKSSKNKTLFLTGGDSEQDRMIARAGRNISKVSMLAAKAINVYDMLRNNRVIVTKAILTQLQEDLGKRIDGLKTRGSFKAEGNADTAEEKAAPRKKSAKKDVSEKAAPEKKAATKKSSKKSA